jgi:hypothetical protein
MDLLYLLEHCILKTSCEAIVESFCSIIGRHGSAGRHPDQGVYTKEAVVAANGPAMGHADEFLSATNDRIFTSNKDTDWHFVTKLFGPIRLVSGQSSNTLDKLARNEKTRLPFIHEGVLGAGAAEASAYVGVYLHTAVTHGSKASLGGHPGKKEG